MNGNGVINKKVVGDESEDDLHKKYGPDGAVNGNEGRRAEPYE